MNTLKNIIIAFAVLVLMLSFITNRGCWAQELLAGSGNRWAETSEFSAEFLVTPTSNPPNVFIKLKNIYIHFSERGLIIYDGSDQVDADPAVHTKLTQQYHFKVDNGSVYRDDRPILQWQDDFVPIQVGTWGCSAEFTFIDSNEWDFSHGLWLIPGQPSEIDTLRTLRGDRVVLSWEHSKTEPDFAGFDVQALRNGKLLARVETTDLQTQFETPPGEYLFRVAAFDTVPLFSSYAELKAIILASDQGEPTPIIGDTLTGNAVIVSWAHLAPEPGMFFRVYWNGAAKETTAMADTLFDVESGWFDFQMSAVDSAGNETERVPNPAIEFYFQKYEGDIIPPALPVMVEARADTLK